MHDIIFYNSTLYDSEAKYCFHKIFKIIHNDSKSNFFKITAVVGQRVAH